MLVLESWVTFTVPDRVGASGAGQSQPPSGSLFLLPLDRRMVCGEDPPTPSGG